MCTFVGLWWYTPLIPALGRQADLCELKASLVYRESSRTDRATQRKIQSQQNKNCTFTYYVCIATWICVEEHCHNTGMQVRGQLGEAVLSFHYVGSGVSLHCQARWQAPLPPKVISLALTLIFLTFFAFYCCFSCIYVKCAQVGSWSFRQLWAAMRVLWIEPQVLWKRSQYS